MGGNPWIRRRGSRLWDPKTSRATLLPPVIDQPNGSVAFLHSSSKSSGTACEWFFVLARPRLRTNYCRSPVTLLAKFSLWTVPGGIRAKAVFHSHAPSVFLPLNHGREVLLWPLQATRDSYHGPKSRPDAEKPSHSVPLGTTWQTSSISLPPNVKMPSVPKLTATDFHDAPEPAHLSPEAESRKSSPIG